jgi:hypothetical protein
LLAWKFVLKPKGKSPYCLTIRFFKDLKFLWENIQKKFSRFYTFEKTQSFVTKFIYLNINCQINICKYELITILSYWNQQKFGAEKSGASPDISLFKNTVTAPLTFHHKRKNSIWNV